MTPTELVEERKGASSFHIKLPSWHHFSGDKCECRVLICPEDCGGYSAHALRLPGVVSQGESVEESLENIADAFRAALSVYQEAGEEIPWKDLDMERPKGSIERWMLVDV